MVSLSRIRHLSSISQATTSDYNSLFGEDLGVGDSDMECEQSVDVAEDCPAESSRTQSRIYKALESQRWKFELPDDLHRKKQVPWIVVQRLESILLVKGFRGVIDCINFDRLNSNPGRQKLGASEGVEKKEFAKPLPFDRGIDGQLSDQNDRHVNVRKAFRLIGR